MTTSPAIMWIDITPSDVTKLDDVRSLFIGASGDIVLEGADGNTSTFTVQSGQILPCSPVRVLATGTTATNIVGLI